MKRNIQILLAAVLVLTVLAACGEKKTYIMSGAYGIDECIIDGQKTDYAGGVSITPEEHKVLFVCGVEGQIFTGMGVGYMEGAYSEQNITDETVEYKVYIRDMQGERVFSKNQSTCTLIYYPLENNLELVISTNTIMRCSSRVE